MGKTKFSKDFIIGYLLGETIWLTKMPTLSNNPCRSRTIIEVSKEDAEREREASKIWYNDQTKENWKKYQTVRIEIEEKYVPKEFIFHSPVWIEINLEVKDGIKSFLWDTDGCEYSLYPEDITITQNEYFSSIKFIYRERTIIY